jgi:hypothetical protein
MALAMYGDSGLRRWQDMQAHVTPSSYTATQLHPLRGVTNAQADDFGAGVGFLVRLAPTGNLCNTDTAACMCGCNVCLHVQAHAPLGTGSQRAAWQSLGSSPHPQCLHRAQMLVQLRSWCFGSDLTCLAGYGRSNCTGCNLGLAAASAQGSSGIAISPHNERCTPLHLRASHRAAGPCCPGELKAPGWCSICMMKSSMAQETATGCWAARCIRSRWSMHAEL